MRKTSQDGGDSSSITSGIENEMKKPGAGILKIKRTSLKKKVQTFSIESDDAIIEPLLQKDKEKTNENQSAKYLLSKAKTESQSGGDTDKLLGDSKVSKPAISNIPCIANSSLLGNGTKESITPKPIISSTAIIHNHMNTNVFAGHDFNSIASKTPILVEIGSTKQSGYSPSPLIFTTAKIHTDGKSKHMEPVQVTPVPILSTIEGSIVKSSQGSNYEKYNVNSYRNDINSSGIIAKPLTSVKDQPTMVPNSIAHNTVHSINDDNFKANSNISTNATTSRETTTNTDNAYSVNKTNDSVAENTKNILTNKLTDPNISHLGKKNDPTAKSENENKELTKAAEKLALNITANNKTGVSVTQNTSIDFNKNVESDLERPKKTIMCNTSDINKSISTKDSAKATDNSGSKSLLHQQDTLSTRVSPNSVPKGGTSVENTSFSNTTKDSNDISFPQAVLDSGKSKTEQSKLDAQNVIGSNGSVSNSLKFPVTVSKTREQSGIGSACSVKSPVNSTKNIETSSKSEFGTEGKTLHTSAKPITTEIPSDKKSSVIVSEARNKTSVPSEKPPTTNISAAAVSVTSSAKPASTISSKPLSTNKSNTNVSHNTKSGNPSVKSVSTTTSKTDSKSTTTTSKTVTSKQPAMSTVKTITSSFPQPSKAKNSNFSNTQQAAKTPGTAKKNESLTSMKSLETTSSSVPSKVSTVTTMKPMTAKASSSESNSKNATATPSVSATPSAKVSVSNKKAETKANDHIKDGKDNKA